MDQLSEQILIVYSTEGTPEEALKYAQEAIDVYSGASHAVRVKSLVFTVPNASKAGASLGTELTRQLDASVGAIVFVDDLRPNVAYELGYSHGRGRSVLLLTTKQIEDVWSSISDLAGAPLAFVTSAAVGPAVTAYLDSLYIADLARMDAVATLPLPEDDRNLLDSLEPDKAFNFGQGPFGRTLLVSAFDPPVDMLIGKNIFPGARVQILLRATDVAADYSVYCRVRFRDRLMRPLRVWLGISSLRRELRLTYSERQFPGSHPTTDWRMLVFELADMVQQSFLLGGGPPDYLERVRFRAGDRDRPEIEPIEIGFLGIQGADD